MDEANLNNVIISWLWREHLSQNMPSKKLGKASRFEKFSRNRILANILLEKYILSIENIDLKGTF